MTLARPPFVTGPLCNNCGHETTTIAPCPCGLGRECPLPGGVCDDCYHRALANAIDRRRDRAA